MIISMIDYTNHAKEMLIFSKNTRHLTRGVKFDDVLSLSDEDKDKEIEYVFNTIGSALEFVHYTFLLQDVTRAFTHQLVRHRTGTAFAQQSLRVSQQEDFAYFIPNGIEKDSYKVALYTSTMSGIQDGYNILLRKGTDTQDARGVLPTNICTNILLKINLRALSHLMKTRLCVRAQGEFQEVALSMKKLVGDIHPWVTRALQVACIADEKCQFPRFDKCPLKKKYKHLNPIEPDLAGNVKADWEYLMKHSYSPQPIQDKGGFDE